MEEAVQDGTTTVSWGGDMYYSAGSACFGVRPVVALKANIKASTTSNTTTHNTPETAWSLSLD
mgnify:CR=1 FL=1